MHVAAVLIRWAALDAVKSRHSMGHFHFGHILLVGSSVANTLQCVFRWTQTPSTLHAVECKCRWSGGKLQLHNWQKNLQTHSTRRPSVTKLYSELISKFRYIISNEILLLFVACSTFYLFEADEFVCEYELIIYFIDAYMGMAIQFECVCPDTAESMRTVAPSTTVLRERNGKIIFLIYFDRWETSAPSPSLYLHYECTRTNGQHVEKKKERSRTNLASNRVTMNNTQLAGSAHHCSCPTSECTRSAATHINMTENKTNDTKRKR